VFLIIILGSNFYKWFDTLLSLRLSARLLSYRLLVGDACKWTRPFQWRTR